jgi:hypothetical protein
VPAPRSARVWLSRNGWLVAIAAAYLYCFPYYPGIQSANELPRVYLVQAIVQDHTFAVDRGVARWGTTVDVSPSGGHQYSNKAPGASFLAVPVFALVNLVATPTLATSMWICRVVAGVVPTLLFLWLLVGFLERITPDLRVRRLVAIVYALGSMAMTYSVLFYSHQLAAVCIASAWMLALDVADKKRGLGAMAIAGFLAGYAPVADYQGIFAALPVAIHVIWRMRAWPRRELAKAIAIATVAALPPILLLLEYHATCYGSPWRTGYDASETFANFHQHGFLGITELRATAFYGSFLSPDNGLFTLAPWLLLAFPGAVYVWRKDRAMALACLGAILVYGLFISSINFWRGGWGVGPRYITELIPFTLPLVCGAVAAWRDKPWHLAGAAALMVVGVAIYVLSTATFPHWPEMFKNPFYEVTLRLLRDDTVPRSLGYALGVGGVVGLVPYFAVAFGLVGWAIYRVAGWRVLAVATIVGVAILSAYALFPRGDVERQYQWVHGVVAERQGR